MNIPKEASAYNFTANVNQLAGYWLPAIQRKFVWNEEKICKLFDSMMRSYPIGTCLLWGTNKEIRKRTFITNFTKGIDPRTLFVPGTKDEKIMILDGQQRIQSLLVIVLVSVLVLPLVLPSVLLHLQQEQSEE